MGLVVEVKTSNEWHVMKGEVQYGPFSYAEMLQMLQNKTLYAFDFTWAVHMDAWGLVGDQPEFSPDRIHRIVTKSTEQSAEDAAAVFARRKHPRVDCDFPVLVHNNEKLWEGKVQSISEGGVLLIIGNPFFLPGDGITVHFRKDQTAAKGFAQAFNTRMEVLNKRLTKQKLSYDLEMLYVLQFTQLPDLARKSISEFVELNASKQKTGD